MKPFKFLKFLAHTALGSAIFYTGINSIYLKVKKRGITFLAYHDISHRNYLYLQISPDIFEKHISYLSKHFKLVSLSEAQKLLQHSAYHDNNSVVITFDDGYKSVYTTAYPILKKYNAPFTVFLTTESIDTGMPPFVDCLAYAILNTDQKYINLKKYGLQEYHLSNNGLKQRAISDINNASKKMSLTMRKSLLHEILDQLQIDINNSELKNIMLSWEDVTKMSSDPLVEFGAHTHTHPSLAKMSPEEARKEILYSKKVIENHINKEVTSFAYPYGTWNDVNNEVVKLVSNCGFKSAYMLSVPDDSKRNIFNIPRTCVVLPSKSRLFKPFALSYFATNTSGIFDVLKKSRKKYMPVINEKVRILYFIDNLYLTAGTERHLTYLARYMDKSRFTPMICAFKAFKSVAIDFNRKNIPFIILDLDRIYSPSAFKKLLKLRNLIKSYNPHIVQTFHFKSDTYGVLAAKLAGVKHIISSRRDTGDLKKPRQILLNRIANRFIDKFIMVCDRVGESFHRLEGIPYEKMVTLYNGVDINRFHPIDGKNPVDLRARLGYKEDDFIVGTTAIFRPEKAYHILFEGIEKVMPQIPNLKVIICGDGPTRRHFEEYCKSHPIGKIVKFMGYVNDTENYLPLMDVFCLVPNRNEGFSNAILEAMAMARPVIATDVGGNAEAVVHGETGIIIPPDDPDSLAEAILDLYRNPVKRLQMGQKARERAVNVFSLERMIKEHENFYHSLINEPNEPNQPNQRD